MAGLTDDNQKHGLEEALQQFVNAQLQGQKPDIDEFVKRYPELEDQIRKRISKLNRINTLLDSIVQVDESDFEETASAQDLIGQKIGNFEIVELIGRGGMGVVYLARDTKLDRSVAIKSMPTELQASTTARTRFTREAKLLASLSHPNIGVIHEIIEPTEGSAYLVLEYIPGETLAERMARELLPLKDALSIGLQIAEAVCAAHETGVIHRDLKPGNIKITPEGIVKVLDFGLAKALGGEPSEQSTTVTQPGRLMGTPAYMSPEQARGKPTDKRGDIWSFGCMLYEMLTGRIPFEGETVPDTLVHIIERQPDWELLPQEIPSNIRTLLRRCLEKDQRRRLQHMGDVVIEIEETLSLPAVAPPITTATVEKMHPVGLRRLMVWAVVCLLVGAVAASLVTSNLKHPAPISERVSRFIIRPERELTQEALWHSALALSPDGKRLAYVEEGSDSRRRIYLRELDEFEATPLPGTEDAISPFFSPDGRWIGYVDSFQRKLKKVSVQGGAPVSLCDCMGFRGGSWGTDDTIIFTPVHREGIWRISASAEGMERLTIPDPNQGELGHFWPQILPGGKAVLFTVYTGRRTTMVVYSLKTGQRHKLFEGGIYARYVPTGHIVYAYRNTLYAKPFDVKQLKVVGSSVPVVPDVSTTLGESSSAQYAFAQDGTLAYIPLVTRSTKLIPVWVDRKGRVESLPGAIPRDYYSVAISPDGTQVAFGIGGGDNANVWIYDLTQHRLTPLTSSEGGNFPVWIPDGKWVVFRTYRAGIGIFQMFRQNVTGSGEPELLAEFEGVLGRATCCSPDGKALLVTRYDYDPNHPMWDNNIWVASLEQNGKYLLRPFTQRDHVQRQGVWSPDGRWIAYSSDESGRMEVYVEAYPDPGQKVMISSGGGCQPAWSRDSKELFYRYGNKMIAASFETKPDFRVIGFEELFEGQYLCNPIYRNYDVASDGRFLMIQEPQEPTPLGINVVLNWFEELKLLAPPRKE